MILRAAMLAGSFVGAARMLVGALTGDTSAMLLGIGPLAVAGLAAWQMAKKGSVLPLFYATTVVAVVHVVVQPSMSAFSSGAYAVVALTLGASLLAPGRRVPIMAAGGALLLLSFMRWRTVDEAFPDLVLATVAPFAVAWFGSQLTWWAQHEISRREQRFENLFDHAPVAIWEEDFTHVSAWLQKLRQAGIDDLRSYLVEHPSEARYGASLIEIVDVNDKVLEFVQAPTRESLLGFLDPSLILEDTLASITEELLAVWEGRSNLRVDVSGTTLLGNPIDGFLMMAAPRTLWGIDWSRVVVMMVDVSELRATQRRLEELVDSKDRFVASVSHELRTPLAAVIGLAEELRSDPAGFSADERAELVSVIADQAIDVGNIVEDLLVAARADIGKVTIHPEDVDLAGEITRITGAFDASPAFRAIHPEARAIFADPRRLRQILRNMISNAYRYGGDHVEIEVNRQGPQVLVDVKDDGAGIPDELRDRVFEPYETAHAVSGVTGAVGLGLTVSRQLARLMGGDLSYHRIDGATVFRLSLPASPALSKPLTPLEV